MSESVSIDEGWEESLDSEQVTHVKGELSGGLAPAGEWLVNVSEQVIVPMTTTDVVEALRSRRVTDRSLVWRAGMQDWAALGEVPQLRLAAGPLAVPQRVSAVPAARVSRPPSERALQPPPKEPARAARDERVRRNTLPFGFPVVRDPATIREPVGLHAAPVPAPVALTPAQPEEVEALAIYERATPSLTFSDSVRAEWQGTGTLVHQPAQSAPNAATAPSAPPPVIARPAPRPRPEPRIEPKARLSLEPQSDPKPRLTLEPQSDPMQSARPEAPFKISGSQPPSSIAPTTSEPDYSLPARGAGMWGDLSVVLASDMRAVQASSKRVTWIASLSSAALASVLTLWFAHSYNRHSAEPASLAQPAPVSAPVKLEAAPVPPVVAIMPAPSALPVAAHAAAVPSAVATVHAVPGAVAVSAPRMAVRPKPTLSVDSEVSTSAPATDTNPYADPASPSDHVAPKTPTAAFKETGPAPSEDVNAPAVPKVPSGLEDSASPARPAPTAAPGF